MLIWVKKLLTINQNKNLTELQLLATIEDAAVLLSDQQHYEKVNHPLTDRKLSYWTILYRYLLSFSFCQLFQIYLCRCTIY